MSRLLGPLYPLRNREQLQLTVNVPQWINCVPIWLKGISYVYIIVEISSYKALTGNTERENLAIYIFVGTKHYIGTHIKHKNSVTEHPPIYPHVFLAVEFESKQNNSEIVREDAKKTCKNSLNKIKNNNSCFLKSGGCIWCTFGRWIWTWGLN